LDDRLEERKEGVRLQFPSLTLDLPDRVLESFVDAVGAIGYTNIDAGTDLIDREASSTDTYVFGVMNVVGATK
jgi:hypothetical protein